MTPENPLTPEQLEAHKQALEAYEKKTQETIARVKAQCQAEHDEVVKLGGLFILGTERHESRRIDNQLRGRAGRQGDPGMSKFYLSLEDDLMRIFGSDRISGLMERMGMQEGEVIEHRWLTKAIANAQEKVEAHHFDSRKNLLEYDDVMNQQRKTIYSLRKQVLGAGADFPVVEYDEDPKTKKKTRREMKVTWADQRERVLDYIEDIVINITEEFCLKPNNPQDWDLPSLEASVREHFNVSMSFSSSGASNREELQEQIFNVVQKAYEEKEKEIGEQNFRRLEQYIFLSTIDALWVGVADQQFLFARHDHVVDADRNTRAGCIQEAEVLHFVQHANSDLQTKLQVAILNELRQTFFLQQPIDERHVGRKMIVHDHTADSRVHILLHEFDGLGVEDVLVVERLVQVDDFARIAQLNGSQRFHFFHFERDQHIVGRGERAAFAWGPDAFGQVVAAKHHVLCGNGDRSAMRRRQNIV